MATMPDAVNLGVTSNPNVAKIAMAQQKKKTDVVEPQVIDEQLLRQGVEEPLRPDGELTDPIDFPKVTSLRLSFQNIIEISNLNNFDSLTTLRLDNNIIDCVTNLDHLSSLTWLDLSFNNIRKIEGLSKLSNLTDLSLYHNHIDKIEAPCLDGCKKLNILSLGKNQISELKDIDYLRSFPNLRCLCMEGNKVCDNDSYQQHVLAYLTNLKYLDYMLIEKNERKQAQEGYQMDDLTELRDQEESEAAKELLNKEKQEVLEKLRSAFLDCTEDFAEELFAKNVEPENVTVLSCYAQLKDDYRDKLNEDIKTLRDALDKRNEDRIKKVGAFEKAVAGAEKESEDEALQLIRQFWSLKKKVLAQLDASEIGGPKAEQMLTQLLEELETLLQHLMSNEIQLQESIEEAITEFEVKMEDSVKYMSDKREEFFRRLEELEKQFHIGLLEGANSEMDSFAQQNQDLADDPKKAKFLGNREEMHQACSTFNEAHVGLIQNKDDYMQNQMNNWKKTFFDKHREMQYHRNRQRIMDIKKVYEECKEEITSAGETNDDDYERDDGSDQYTRYSSM